MSFELMKLPYELDALEPTLSKETLEYHYLKHHKTYIDKLNGLIKDTEHDGKTLIDIAKNSTGPLFNNAAQVINHDFYWLSLTPKKQEIPQKLLNAIEKNFTSFENFKKIFIEQATNNFGSGWTWLLENSEGVLSVENTSNAKTPFTRPGVTPLFTIDVWEHAYYVDYRNLRPSYLEKIFNIINFEFASNNMK